MQAQFDVLKNNFEKNKFNSLIDRKEKLRALKNSIIKLKEELCIAASTDFGQRDISETNIIEILPVIQSIDYSLKHLNKWIKPEKRHTSILFFTGKNKIQYQPLGVIGIISPWNYPILLSLGPLISAISAGNTAMLKLSEFTPNTNKILIKILQESLKNDCVIIEGDAKIAAKFSELPFDHILYTGSSEVGKLVMQSASKNLTPVTLELGGKSPLIIAPDIQPKKVSDKILFGKMTNSGQTCVGIDYLLVENSKLLEFAESIQNSYAQYFNEHVDYTSIINERHFERLNQYVLEAKELGATIITCENKHINHSDKSRRIFPLTLILNAPLSCKVWQEELFGPILPIHTYNQIDEAINFINQRPHPLALYLFTHDKKLQEKVIKDTLSGGVTINDSIIHVAQDDLPFGGVGTSGMGSYHASEGFKTFSHAKSIHSTGLYNSSSMSYPNNRDGLLKHILNFIIK